MSKGFTYKPVNTGFSAVPECSGNLTMAPGQSDLCAALCTLY